MKRLGQFCAILMICTFSYESALAQTQHDRIHARGASTFDQLSNTQTMVISGSTPSIAGGNVFRTSNSSPATITNFLGGVDSQVITVICGDANTTIQNNANIAITGGSNFSCSVNAALSFVYRIDITMWLEIGGTGGGGGGGSPGSPAQSFQCNNGSGGFVACAVTDDTTNVNVNENARFKGPNPYVDITAFGARAGNPNATPYAVGLTANCTSASTTCAISSASTFVNGDGVIIYGAGAAQSMTTPGAPTVTPSLSLAGTGTLINTPGPVGATTYNYRVIARDRNGGLTAPSTTGSTTTGAATLGAITVNITSMSRSTQTVTVVTATAHGFLVGCNGLTCGEVEIGGGNALSDASFRGWFTVTSATDTTHFTFVGPPSTALGASTSATGGTATFYNSNSVCAPGVVTGAVYYAFYSDRAVAGTYALIGVSNPSGTQTDLCIEDFGSPMMDNQAFPAIFPASFAAGSPPSATSDSLSTTIASGAGTTTLTLANAAGTTVSGATIRLDAVPAIKAAAAAITTGYGTLYIPADVSGNSFVVNSWLQLSGNQLAVSQSGALYLNDTMETAACSQGCAKWIGDVLPQHPVSGSNVGWSPMPVINVNSAHPGFFIAGSPQGVHISHIKIAGVPVNGTLGILMEAGQNQTLDWIDCAPGSGANDYMSSCFQFRLNPGNNSPGNITLDYVGMSPGGGTDGASHTPVAYCRNCGNMIIPHAYLVHRGMQYWGSSVAQLGVGGVVYINGGGSPLLTMYGNPVAGNAVIGNIVLDTFAHPCVAGLVLPVSIQFMNGVCAPSSAVLPVSGTYSVISGLGNTAMTTFPNLSATISSQGIVQNYANGFNVTGTSSSAFVNNVPMAAPTCAVNAGGTLAVGTYLFSIVPVWWNGLEGQWSLPSTPCTTTTGNQTITLNWATSAGNPQFYNIYFCTGACNPAQGAGTPLPLFHLPPTSTSVGWSATGVNQLVATGMSRGGPTMLMDGIKGIATPKIIVGGGTTLSGPVTPGQTAQFTSSSGFVPVTPEAFTNSPRAPLQTLLPGALTTTWTGETFTLDKAITVTRVQAQVKTIPSGCSPNAIVRVTDGTSPINLTISAAANDSGAITQNYSAGAVLTVSVQTAAAGCSTSPGDANVAVQYKTQ